MEKPGKAVAQNLLWDVEAVRQDPNHPVRTRFREALARLREGLPPASSPEVLHRRCDF